MKEYEIGWERLTLPNHEEESEEEDEYDDDPKVKIGQIFIPHSENPFFQLKSYNFWTGHTNFRLSQPVVLIINSVLGVESLEVVSPYRFHISVGQRFDQTDVKSAVQTQVIEFLKEYEEKSRNKQHN